MSSTTVAGAPTASNTGPSAETRLARTASDADANLMAMSGELIRTPHKLVERMRQLQAQAHVLSPATSVAAIPEYIAINPVVVVIDPTFDAATGRGTDVYFQRSIHKSDRRGRGEDATYIPREVSLSKNGLLKILDAFGVDITSSVRTDDGTKPNYWSWCSTGRVRQFDGSWRALPPGNVEVDLQDGSSQIGEWNPEEWTQHEATAEQKKAATPQADKWKVKPELIGGFSQERVISARRFGLRMAESKSLTALVRNLGIKQIYSLEELNKPFVIFRATFMPDMQDPEVRRMVTAAQLGATNLLGYPDAPALSAQVASSAPRLAASAAPDPSPAAAPGEAEEITDFPEDATVEADVVDDFPSYHVTKTLKSGNRFFFETREEQTFTTTDAGIARAMHAAGRAGTALDVDHEPVEVGGKTYRTVISMTPVVASGLPTPGQL